MNYIETIEKKLENGQQQFSAQEVAFLLNRIRVLKAFIKIEKGNK